MRISDDSPVNRSVLIGLSIGELQFYLGLLTQLKSDDLLTEDARQEAIACLSRVLAHARDATKS